MSRSKLTLLVLLLSAPLLPGCGAKPNGAECSGAFANNRACSGAVCLPLVSNQQKKEGMCSQSCTSDRDCQEGGSCLEIEPLGGAYCLRRCAADRDCLDGFVCIGTEAGSYCGVRAGQAQPGGENPGAQRVDCKASPNCIATAAPAGYCDHAPASTQVCDCVESPARSCVAAPNGANLWCCP